MLKNCELVFVLLLVFTATVDSSPETTGSEGHDGPNCGYESCGLTDPNRINVHIVAHTHDDVGWLKTVDQYYYGSKNYVQKAGVQYILDSVVSALLQDPKKKFIYVESAFFFKWWDEQTPELQEQVKMLVAEGRLEFVGGAWSMNDEATTHYQSIIDQFTLGLRRLNDTFGECGRPKVGWQIDPFGHSREMASIFAQMSYDGLFFGRLHYLDKSNRLRNKEMEMIWQASSNLGESSDIFTGALFNTYSPPSGFCWDVLCSDEPFVDNKQSRDYNVNRLLDLFISYVHHQHKHFRTNNVIMTMGGDFTFQDANYYYKNLDKLIKYGNERKANGSNFHFLYSTPSCYLKALKDASQTWPTYAEDFFPYASDSTAVWTGFFTSRPTFKRYERMGNHFLQICKQLTSLAFLKGFAKRIEPDNPKEGQSLIDRLTVLREEMGVMQHHDAVTGTEKQHVANDYIHNMYNALQGCNENVKLILNEFSTPTTDEFDQEGADKPITSTFEFESCHLLNISQCHISENSKKFMVTVYNPLAHSTFQPVRIPVYGSKFQVRDYREIPVHIQMVPITDRVVDLPFRNSAADFEITFLAQEIPALGYKSYFIEAVPEDLENKKNASTDKELLQKETPSKDFSWRTPTSLEKEIEIGNENVKALFDTRSGMLNTVIINGESHNISQEFFYYPAASGYNISPALRASGAYILRPNGSEIYLREGRVEVQIIRGDVLDEVYQQFNEWLSQVVRIYHDNTTAIEFEWTVGPIPVQDHIGKEIVSRFSSDIESAGVFYTDSNGREMIKRTRNNRPLYHEEKVAINYYPLNSKIFVEDERNRMAVLTDRAQGTTSLRDGAIDVMVHRRLLYDDAFGVDEPLNERQYGKPLIATGKLQLVFSGKKAAESPSPAATERFLQNRLLLPNWLFFSSLNSTTYEEWLKKYKNIGSTLTLALPQNVYLMTLEPWRENSYLLRFEHVLEKDEDPNYSKATTFDLIDVFGTLLSIRSVRETNLAGNVWISDVKRFKFQADKPREGREIQDKDRSSVFLDEQVQELKEEGGVFGEGEEVSQILSDDSLKYSITLSPMQIRTFVIDVREKI